MATDCVAKRGSSAQLIVFRSRVSALQKLGRANAGAQRHFLEQRIGICGLGRASAERSALEDCAQALAVGNAGSLSLLVELVEESQLGHLVVPENGILNFVEGDSHRCPLSVGVRVLRTLQAGTAAQCLLRVNDLSDLVYRQSFLNRSCAQSAAPLASWGRERRRGAHIHEPLNSVRALSRAPRLEGLFESCPDPTGRR